MVVCPHLDDELWSAELLLREIEAGAKVTLCYLTSDRYRKVEDSVIRLEAARSIVVLGAQARRWCCLHPYALDEKPSTVRDALHIAMTDANPDLVILPSSLDWHQDHICAYKEGRTIAWRRDCDILGYVVPGTAYLETWEIVNEPRYRETKQAMIDCYESQKFRGRVDAERMIERYEPIRVRK